MECIQNADDNKYSADCTPILKISISEKEVQIECNEAGFTKDDIEALCRVGRSTKTKEAQDDEHGKRKSTHIGEKGIGFKSVFNLATSVNIASYPFYFELNKDRELGMVAPSWNLDFFKNRPRNSSPLQTTIVLTSPTDANVNFVKTLRRDVESLRPTLLLFLNKLKKLHISAESSNFSLSANFSVSFPDSGDRDLIQLDETGSQTRHWNYFRFDHTIFQLPREKKRPNATNTKISLAFPVSMYEKFWEPVEGTQSVFAYLPVGDYGFRVCFRELTDEGS